MTLSNVACRNEHTASAAQTVFPYTFQIFDDTDLVVYVNTSLVSPSLYTVSGVGTAGGGNVTFTTGLTSGDEVIILSAIPQSQGEDITVGGVLPGQTLETMADRLTRLVHQANEAISRCLLLNVASSFGRSGMELPAPETLTLTNNGKKVLGWNDAETNLTLHEMGQASTTPVNMFTASTVAALPAAGTLHRFRGLTDAYGGVLWDTGVQWAYIGQRVINASHPPFNVKADGEAGSAAANIVGLQLALDVALTYGLDLYIPGGTAPVRLGGHLYWGNSPSHSNGLTQGSRQGNLRMYGDGNLDYLSNQGYAISNNFFRGTVLHFEDGYGIICDGSSSDTFHVRNVKVSDLIISCSTPAAYAVDIRDNSEVVWKDVSIQQRSATGLAMNIHAVTQSINFILLRKVTLNLLTEDVANANGTIGLRIAPRPTGTGSSASGGIVSIEDQCIFRNFGCGLELGNAAGTDTDLTDISIRNCQFQAGGRAIRLTEGVERCSIVDNHLERLTADYAIHVGPVKNVRIISNRIGASQLAAGAAAIDIAATPLNVTVAQNQINNVLAGNAGIRVAPGGQNLTIEENFLDADSGGVGTGIDLGTGTLDGARIGPNYFNGLLTNYAGDQTYLVRYHGKHTHWGAMQMGKVGTAIASAETITLNQVGNAFRITGTTNIKKISTTTAEGNSIEPGTLVVFYIQSGDSSCIFEHAGTLADLTTGNLRFRTAANFTLATREAVAFIFLNTFWLCLGSDT